MNNCCHSLVIAPFAGNYVIYGGFAREKVYDGLNYGIKNTNVSKS